MTAKIDGVYFEIIQKHFPDVKAEDVKILSNGNDHFVYVVKEQIAFRFPKIPREIDSRRSDFLKELMPLSPFPLPTIEIHKDENTGLYYEMNTYIPGVSFYPEIARAFSRDELIVVAQKLGTFLSVVHSFPIERARELQLDELNPNDFWEFMEQNPTAYPKFKQLVFPHVSKEEQDWIEKLFTDFIYLAKEKPLPLRVIHGDMWVFHVIVNPIAHTLSGVIDFWGRIADPANDFKAFEYYGKDFVKEVYKSYSLPIDEDFEKRRLFYTGHDEVFEFARQLEKGDKEKIAKHQISLSKYIKSHPLI
jgi:aminoglycoside 2''-phosphotransferase